jgi:predicted glutamine amidotransferase
MCVIAVSQNGKKFPYEWLLDMWLVNDDGAGVAYVVDDQIHVRKGFMTFSSFNEFYEKLPEIPHVIHFRLASIGAVSKQFTHPFRIDRQDDLKLKYQAELVLFHNGTIKDYEQFAKLAGISKKNSDTYCLARYLAKLSYNDKIKLLKRQIGSKFVVFSPSSIVLLGQFFPKDDGFWFSNLIWEEYATYRNILKRYNKHFKYLE